MAKRDLNGAVAADTQPLATSGVKKRNDILSFVSRTYTVRGRYLDTNYFDVPAQTYGEGWHTGMRAAKELMEVMKAHPVRDGLSRVPLLEILEEVCGAKNIGAEESRHGARAGFLIMLEEMLHFAAKHADHQTYIQYRIDRQGEIDRRHDALREQEREAKKQVFLARMADARRKRAQQIGG